MGKLVVLLAIVIVLAGALSDTTGATSPNEVKKLVASDAQADDMFGVSVAVSGDVAVVGADLEDAAGESAGAAYIFLRDAGGPGNWGEVRKLTASGIAAGDRFGKSVAISGDTAVVGAIDQDGGGFNAGAAYVFQRDAGGTDNWGEVAKLLASDAETNDRLGWSVAISGDTAIVGAVFEDTGGAVAGTAYVFQRDQGGVGNWGEVKMLVASDAETNDRFGWSVAISGDTAVVGAEGEDAGGEDAGAAYVFRRDQGGTDNWGEVKKLTASDAHASDSFGWSVSVSGDTAFVGAEGQDAGSIDAGAAYVFQRDEGGPDNWGEAKKLTASDGDTSDHFGFYVTATDDTAIVGAYLEDAGASDAGAAYVFQRDEGGPDNWGEVKKLTASDGEAFDRFGASLAISGTTIVVGAVAEDAGGSGAGAAYVFAEAPVAITGDANGDERVDAIDATLVLQFAADLLDNLPTSADANMSGAINSIDAALILQFVAGLLDGLPP